MVREHEVFDIHNDTFHLYVWCEPGEPITTILRSANERGILLKTPYDFDEDENLQVTTVGKGDNVIDSLSDIYEVIDEDVEFIMEKTSEYQPQLDEDDYESLLTQRQREVLEVAIEKGYYSVPRETSYEEIGEEAGVSAVTVGQILRRAKARLIRNLF
ncbi:MAG: helix-turn-helix domain-containing protein [Halobacteria archaeon]|nr:helix-turn-helix domain-containing protein [Halobacteria archaeon]